MFCVKCGSKIADDQNVCPSCGASVSNTVVSGGGDSVIVVKEENGCAIGILGCLCAIIAVIVIGFALVIIGGIVSKDEEQALAKDEKQALVKDEKQALAESAAVTAEEASKNGEDLIAWIRNNNDQTALAREEDDSFAKMKGKTVILRGKVREIGKTAFSGEVFVSLTVGRLDVLERINVQFNVRESQVAVVKAWNKDEVHTMRGRIKGQGDLFDDAECDMAEVVE